jgi:hypothetical protein
VGDDGVCGLHGAVVHYVCAAQGTGDKRVAVGELDYGGVFCEFKLVLFLMGCDANKEDVGYSLHLPRDCFAALSQSEHVAHASICVDYGVWFSGHERHFNRWLPGGLWANNTIPLGCAFGVYVCWARYMVLGTARQHIPRRRPARDQEGSQPQAAKGGQGVRQARGKRGQDLHDSEEWAVQVCSACALSVRMDRVGGLVDDWGMGIPSGPQFSHQRDHNNAASRAAGQAMVRKKVWQGEARGPESGDSRSAVSSRRLDNKLVADLPPFTIGVETQLWLC